MVATIERFHNLLRKMGSDVVYYREDAGTPCPCLSPEGFRSPEWHKENPAQPVCNEKGRLATVKVNITVKAAVQPVQTSNRRLAERALALFGEIEQDDHIGVFPVKWGTTVLDFTDWSNAGEDYIIYDGRRFTAVSYDKLPDIDGDPDHHWEVGLRILKSESERP